MEKEQHRISVVDWFSTYGVITAQRVLEQYDIRLEKNELLYALTNTDVYYHQLLIMPLYNVLNGIILNQVRDYQSYAQTVFIDYLLSPDADNENEQNIAARESLEELRQKLLDKNSSVDDIYNQHINLIAKCQAVLIEKTAVSNERLFVCSQQITKQFAEISIHKKDEDVFQALVILVAYYDYKKAQEAEISWTVIASILQIELTSHVKKIFKKAVDDLFPSILQLGEELTAYIDTIKSLANVLREMRSNFRAFIIEIHNAMLYLPSYIERDSTSQMNLEKLQFDAEIGESF